MNQKNTQTPKTLFWSDLIIGGIASWVIGKVLDSLWKYTRIRISRLQPPKIPDLVTFAKMTFFRMYANLLTDPYFPQNHFFKDSF